MASEITKFHISISVELCSCNSCYINQSIRCTRKPFYVLYKGILILLITAKFLVTPSLVSLLKINGCIDNGLDIGVASTCMLVSFCSLGQSLHVLPSW